MRPVLSVAEMRRVDAETTVPVDTLMDAAGFAVARTAAEMGAGYGSLVHVLCGRGNNGGDGYVAARYLKRRGAHVVCHHVGLPDEGTPARRALHAARSEGVAVIPIGAPTRGTLVIDALFGTGFRGELPPEVAPWAGSGMPTLAVDIPSGLNGDTGEPAGYAFRALRTVAFHSLKPGHLVGGGPDYCGTVTVADIGLDGGVPEMWLLEGSDVSVPARTRTAHKWRAGSVVTVGGAPGLTGAALLCARGALATGAGVSSIVATPATMPVYESLAPDIPTSLGEPTAEGVLAATGRFDVLVMGPGLDPAPDGLVDGVLEGFRGPVVIDAGALNALSNLDAITARSAPTIMTPHAGEFARLTGDAPGHEAAMELARSTGAVVLLKGNPTFVAGESLTVIDRGGPELASIGTGDVLAGSIAALVANGVDAEQAAAHGAYLHAEAGARLAVTTNVTAAALIDEVGRVVRGWDENRHD